MRGQETTMILSLCHAFFCHDGKERGHISGPKKTQSQCLTYNRRSVNRLLGECSFCQGPQTSPRSTQVLQGSVCICGWESGKTYASIPQLVSPAHHPPLTRAGPQTAETWPFMVKSHHLLTDAVAVKSFQAEFPTQRWASPSWLPQRTLLLDHHPFTNTPYHT